MNVVAIIQARMGSSRLPGKVMRKLIDQSVLAHVVQRVKQVEEISRIVIATTSQSIDDPIVEEAIKLGVDVVRGSEEDVLSRYFIASEHAKADVVVRITSDCPLLSPEITSEVIRFYMDNHCDYASNTLDRTFPRGLDVEVFSQKSLEKAHYEAVELSHREHVTPYMYQTNQFTVASYKGDEDLSPYRWTLDTIEDWELIQIIYEQLYSKGVIFEWTEVLNLIKVQPSLSLINAHIEQKKV
ncbi:cytidylyltransferase domain-containing protein [Paenibacillus sp. KN14-4R]|uniref:cytidylyltransferase domain-containing protein n=1 Tax=Paenibacillus sp. KN14-4R TaxID=3445773 RepID=UPI003F9F51C5